MGATPNKLRDALSALARKAEGFAHDSTSALPSVAFKSPTEGADAASNYNHIAYEIARQYGEVLATMAAVLDASPSDEKFCREHVEECLRDNVDFIIKQAGEALDEEREHPDVDILLENRIERQRLENV